MVGNRAVHSFGPACRSDRGDDEGCDEDYDEDDSGDDDADDRTEFVCV